MKKRFSLARINRSDYVKVPLSIVFIALVFLPLIRMFTHMDAQSIRRVVNSPVFLTSIINSLVSAVLGTVITYLLYVLNAQIYVSKAFLGLFSPCLCLYPLFQAVWVLLFCLVTTE